MYKSDNDYRNEIDGLIISKVEGLNVYDFKDEIPRSSGVYVLTFEDGRQYVGSSYNLFGRGLRGNHPVIKRMLPIRVKNLDTYLTLDCGDAAELEGYLIWCLKPALNRAKQKVYRIKSKIEKARWLDEVVFDYVYNMEDIIEPEKINPVKEYIKNKYSGIKPLKYMRYGTSKV